MRTRLSIQSASFAALGKKEGAQLPGMFPTLATMYKTEGGFSALYRGIIPTVAGVAPYVSCSKTTTNAQSAHMLMQCLQVGLNFMVYEVARKRLTPEGDKNPNAVRKLLAGAIAGAVAQTCTYPLYVLFDTAHAERT